MERLMTRFAESDFEYCDDEAVISLIERNRLLRDPYGRWPTFADAEIIEFNFLRGNLLECMRSDKWENLCPPSLRCAIYTFDERYAHDDLKRKPSIVSLFFRGVGELYMNGFNYQNAIFGMGIRRVFSTELKVDVFSVAWGGSAIQHDVKFICENIRVESVSPM